jgi:hypothetical protein
LKSGWGMIHKTFGSLLSRRTDGFSILEVSMTLFLTSLLCTLVFYSAIAVWRTGALSTRMAEESGMALNAKRVLSEDIGRAMDGYFDGNAIELTMIDGEQYRFALNDRHQFILHMQNGGTTVIADSVASIDATMDTSVVTVEITFVSGASTLIFANMLGGLLV